MHNNTLSVIEKEHPKYPTVGVRVFNIVLPYKEQGIILVLTFMLKTALRTLGMLYTWLAIRLHR